MTSQLQTPAGSDDNFPAGPPESGRSPPSLGRAALSAAALIAFSAVLAAISPSLLTADTKQRVFGVVLGCLVMFYANAIPKAIAHLAHQRLNAVEQQALHRFTGWALVLGGLGFALSWLWLPLAWAFYGAVGVLGFSVVWVGLRWLTGDSAGAR